jgi:hypothetical protein
VAKWPRRGVTSISREKSQTAFSGGADRTEAVHEALHARSLALFDLVGGERNSTLRREAHERNERAVRLAVTIRPRLEMRQGAPAATTTSCRSSL